ncbi:helicase-related protein [Sphingomonas sp. NFR15]|uniref:helicase-related protein n=1 Tax=Sphingomonas sp. NFR15 TaxID=1566282 RepID=UPI00088CF97C|nr:helicase-related protein [Sphingomonas sp. NFR15]SDA35556.1 transcription-repair coupling factor (superfamily II helicase) [Sphingomonas sp. NFR15]
MNLAFTAFRLAEMLAEPDVVFLADDEQQAEALAAALGALLSDDRVIFVPSSDALPGDSSPASPANTGKRVAALRRLRLAQQRQDRAHVALVLSGEAAARRYPPAEAFDSAPPELRAGASIDAQAFAALAEGLGYFADDRVDEPGEMAIRDAVIDIYPADAGLPARIDIADGRITEIRSYDPATQRTVETLDALEIGRAAEPPLGQAVPILSHLTTGAIVLADKADRRRARFLQLASDAAERGGGAVDAIAEADWTAALADWKIAEIGEEFEPVPRFAEKRGALAALAKFATPRLDTRALVLAGSRRDLRFLRGKIAKRLGIEIGEADSLADLAALTPGAASAIVMPVECGFVDAQRIVIAAGDLLGSRAVLDDVPALASERWNGGVGDIRIGDVVIHEDHGAARVAGLEPAPEASGAGREMIALEYADGARRLVEIDDADRIWRYGADADAVTLDKLDGSSWQKRRGTIQAAIAESARQLAKLAAARETLTAPVIEPDPAAYERFVHGFPFNETADQARAIHAVRADLASGKPMDRLVVGDVGYGKTEVALRAAALAALAGYQVIVAAPTTVLVRQHLESFRRRFAASGITVAGLSRLSSAAEKKTVKAGLADGSIQIVVGTGAVMGKGVRYAKLGLVVIDEEQRFGAADKARLRGSGETHLLALSATPIPRTLQMALVGLQQISVIGTPPARRQPIRTSVDHYDDARLRTALLREKSRGGQSFVVVPRIEDMAPLAEKLRRAAPDLALVQAHGKLPAAEIDAVMVGFAEGEGDILLATNIIEAGLDVPRANTMIVWRADRFGLAQLHQLRGRVGRGNRRGQVILLTKTEDAIGERTLKRLRTLATFDRLGAGFEISARDLDMRGAGDLLGDDQTGHMKLIGTDLYQHLLGGALREARGETVEHWTPELNLGEAGAFPESWIPEPDVRLALYVRYARIEDDAALDAFEEELLDRFGPLPPAAAALMLRARIRIAAHALRIERIDAGTAAIALTPRRGFDADAKAAGLDEKNGRLLLREPADDPARSERVHALLEDLAA